MFCPDCGNPVADSNNCNACPWTRAKKAARQTLTQREANAAEQRRADRAARKVHEARADKEVAIRGVVASHTIETTGGMLPIVAGAEVIMEDGRVYRLKEGKGRGVAAHAVEIWITGRKDRWGRVSDKNFTTRDFELVEEEPDEEVAEEPAKKVESTEAPANFRVSTNQGFAVEFRADTPSELADGIRKGWDRYITEKSGFGLDRLGHPGIAARVRLGQIDQWEAERAGRDATPEVRRDWEIQAGIWRRQAESKLGISRGSSPLYLHAWEAGRWNAITTRGTASGDRENWLRVIRVEENPVEIWELAAGAREHVRSIAGVASDATEGWRKPNLKLI